MTASRSAPLHRSSFILHPSLFLLALTLLAYAPFFWERGFYWDEAPWTWIYYRLGPAALTRTFSTSRPFWGMIYQVTLPLIGPQPWAWQILMILLRWVSGLLVWKLLARVFPNSRIPLWSAALFVVYPGLGQNFIALMYTHFYIVLNVLLLSLYFSVRAVQTRNWLWHIPAVLLALINLLTMEYFYFLEFFRLALWWLVLETPTRARARQVIRLAWPYLAVFVGVTLWRAFFFPNQNASYTYQTLEDLRLNLLWGLGKLLWNMLQAFWTTIPAAWLSSFAPVNPRELGLFTTLGAFGLALLATLLSGLYLRPSPQASADSLRMVLLLGLLAWLLGGGAFWLVGERTLPQLHFSADRFTLSFMLGSSLMVAALLARLHRFPRMQGILLALLLGFAVGKHFQTNAIYRRDWETQRIFFWQLAWRAPALQPGTTLLTNDLPLTTFSDNSLSGPLNWIYNANGRQNLEVTLDGRPIPGRDSGMNYILYFVSVRAQEGRALAGKLEPGHSFSQNYLATTFHGNTSQILVVNFSPPGCVRILDPEIDPLNKLLPPDLREAAFLSNPALVRTFPPIRMPALYAPEPPHRWCYYFARAEFARQQGDWPTVAQLHRQALKTGDSPNDPLENFVFIEGYAHLGEWEKARTLTHQTYRISREFLRSTLCALWGRIARDVPESIPTVQAVREDLNCNP